MIYFIRDTLTNHVKIGHSRNPRKRLNELQTGSVNWLELMACLPGTAEDEAKLHKRFAKDRVRGEWFAISRSMLEFFSLRTTEEQLREAYKALLALRWFGRNVCMPGGR